MNKDHKDFKKEKDIKKESKKFSDEDLSERQKRIEELGIESLKRARKYVGDKA